MDPNEKQPVQSPFQRITSRLSRDSLVLIAALAFLGLAILLAVFFPAGNSGGSRPAGTAVAGGGTAVASATRATTTSATAATQPTTGGASQGSATAGTSQSLNPYPAPQTSPSDEGIASDTPEGGFDGEPTAPSGAIPTFAPARPTQSFPGTVPTPAGGGFVPRPAPYPGPGSGLISPTATDDSGAGAEATDTPVIVPPRFQPTPQVPRQPTVPRSTPRPQPTTANPAGGAATVSPAQPTVPPPPPAPPMDTLRGTIRWTAAQSPIIINRDQQLVAGASLIIEPGVEVQLGPGVSFFVDGTLYALGQPDRPVRFVGTPGQRWNGLFGRPGSDIALEHTDIRQSGAGGTALASEGGNLVLHTVHVNDSGGHIQVNGSRLEMRDSEVAGNDMPYGAAVDVTYSNGGNITLINNRIGGNRMSDGAAPVRITSESALDTVRLDIQSNLLIGQTGPDLDFFTNGPLQGSLTCNALLNGTDGLSLRSQAPQIDGLALDIHDNAVEDHTPPIIPIYIQYGIGRGATSALALDMRNNWWGSPVGPYEPDRHADGRGEAVGDTIEFAPWLTARPACAPQP